MGFQEGFNSKGADSARKHCSFYIFSSGLHHRRDCGALAVILDLPHELVKNTYMGTAKRQVPGSLMTLGIA